MTMPPLTNAVLALRDGRWSEYESIIRPLRDANENDTWDKLAAEHSVSVNLLAVLTPLSKIQAQAACRYLLPAIGRVPFFSVEDAVALLNFSENLGQSYRHVPARALEAQIRRTPRLGVEIAEKFKAIGNQSEARYRVWASAFAGALPLAAARYAVQLMTGDVLDTQM
jgi:hypothetical protein